MIQVEGIITTVTLTSLVGFESDEEVGNDSFLGALAAVKEPDDFGLLKSGGYFVTREYYAIRRHQEPSSNPAKPKSTADYLKHAGLVDVPVRFDIEAEMACLLDERMNVEATEAQKKLAGGVAPALKVQPFQVADGSLRYYVRATWKSGRETALQHPYALGAWMAPRPKLHILAEEKRTTGYGDFGVPDLLNVVDLGNGRTGIIVDAPGDDSFELELIQYRDGGTIKRMRILQSLGAGE